MLPMDLHVKELESRRPTSKEIFLRASDLASTTERCAYLDLACAGDSDLRQKVERLLVAEQHLLQSPLDAIAEAFGPAQQTAATVLADSPKLDVSTHPEIGPYKLLEQIGEGGMGAVYMAQQTTPVKRRVALKIIKPGMDSREVIARFEAERQALAMMDHPNIACVLDGGTTTEGRPYFVMELVRGVPLTDYCHEKQLGLEQRLQLFINVCRAVQHAHQKGIIHRDLKPSNILVTLHDGVPVVKVIDFGVAKALNQELTDRTLFTHFSQMIGTPLYMAPEQAEISGLDIDTRSDIYSLGVILYELLTGTTPFDRESLSKLGFDGFRKVLREQDPPRPSVRVSTLNPANLSTLADKRRVAIDVFSSKLKRELDWIVMKALEKDRERRYESATALATDVQAYLDIEPVSACPPSAGYRLKKYLRRHRLGVSWGLAGIAVLLLCGTLIAYPHYREADRIEGVRRQVELAQREAETALQAGDLSLAEKSIANAKTLISPDRSALAEVVAQIDALAAEVQQRQSDQILYRDLLSRAGDAQDRMTYGKHLKGDAAAEITLSTSFGVLERDDWLQFLESSYLSQEQKTRVRETIYETLLCLADHGPRWQGTAESAKHSLELLKRAEEFHPPTKALHWVRSECHRILDETEARDQALALYAATRAATALDHYLPGHTAGWRGDLGAAMEAYRAALRIQPDHYNSLFFLGERLKVDQQYGEAIAYYTACIALRPNHVYAIVGRADAYEESGDKDSAQRDYVSAIEANTSPNDHVYAFRMLLEFYLRNYQREQHANALARLQSEFEELIAEQTSNAGPDDPDTAQLLAQLGETLSRSEAYNTGIPLLQESLTRHKAAYGPFHKQTIYLLNELGVRLTDSGRAVDGIPFLEEALDASRRTHGQTHQYTFITSANLGKAYADAGRAQEGISLLETAVDALQQTDDRADVLTAMQNLGVAYIRAQMWDKAVPTLEQLLEISVKELGAEHKATLITTWQLGIALQGSGQLALAVSMLEDALKKHTSLLGAEVNGTLLVLNDLAVAMIDAGRSDDAIPLLSRCVEVRRRDWGEESGKTMVATFNLAAAYLGAARYGNAIDLFEQLLETHTRLQGPNHPESHRASGALLEAYRLAGKRDEGKQLALSRLQIVRAQHDEIPLASALAAAADALLTFEDFAAAESLARECLEIRANLMPDTWLHFNAQSLLGGALTGMEKYAEAEPLLLKAIAGLDRHKAEIPPSGLRHIDATVDRLVTLYKATNRTEEAARWQARQPPQD